MNRIGAREDTISASRIAASALRRFDNGYSLSDLREAARRRLRERFDPLAKLAS